MAEPPRRPSSADRDGPPKGLLIGGALAAVVLVVVLLSNLGSEESPGEVTETIDNSTPPVVLVPEEFGDQITVEGTPIGLAIHDNVVTVANRVGASLVDVDKMSRTADPPIQLTGQAEAVAVVDHFVYVLPLEAAVAKVTWRRESRSARSRSAPSRAG